jgi:hypothetical protein
MRVSLLFTTCDSVLPLRYFFLSRGPSARPRWRSQARVDARRLKPDLAVPPLPTPQRPSALAPVPAAKVLSAPRTRSAGAGPWCARTYRRCRVTVRVLNSGRKKIRTPTRNKGFREFREFRNFLLFFVFLYFYIYFSRKILKY